MNLLYQRPSLTEIQWIHIEPEVPSVDDHHRGGDLTKGSPSWSSGPANRDSLSHCHPLNGVRGSDTDLSQYRLLPVALHESLNGLITNGVPGTISQEVSGSL